ncbi:hypothetical protein J2X02_003831 [Pseudoxanthomonas japonensis]|uniref:hypothetical protein n=1 Tax=Pseudoxanthomonas TaxID=83618 RepID=UPI0012EDE75F|nr:MULTISPECIES: hypothetical protein [Pseudoxanthomonas]MDR7070957.1 hypothetical protein [Pseudoxanthomonas japonensis]
MFGLHKKRSWKSDVLPELTGQESSLILRLTNVPCLRDEITGDRKYSSPNFGHDFLMALHDAIGGSKHAYSRLFAGSTITTLVRLPQQSAIGVEMSGKPNDNVRVFESDIADALISAFRMAGLRPN